MFASHELEDVPCPDPCCWRGFVCCYKHNSVSQLQDIISALIGGNNNTNDNANTTIISPANGTASSSNGEHETREPSPKSLQFDFLSDVNVFLERNFARAGNTTERAPPSSSRSRSLSPHSSLPLSPKSTEDEYIPQYSADANSHLLRSIEDVERQLKGGATTEPTQVASPVADHQAQLEVVDSPKPRRHSNPITPARPTSVKALRASIEDVGRQLSRLTRATAIPRTGGSLPTSIGDVEKQLSRPPPYRPRKVEVSSPKEFPIEPASSDISEAEEPRNSNKSMAKTISSSKPIPSIQNKYRINPPIQTKNLSVEERKKRGRGGEEDGKRVKRGAEGKKGVAMKRSRVDPEEEEEESEEDESEESEDDEEEGEEEEEDEDAKTKVTKNKTTRPITPKKPVGANIKNATSKPSAKSATGKAKTIATAKVTLAAQEKINLASKTAKTKPDTTTTTTTTTTAEKPAAPKTPSLFEVGVALTPHQIKAAQQLRIDSGKKFAAGLSASEYPTIIFEVRPKVPRGVRQSYLDKFLVQFLKNFPDNKAQAIEAAVKIESDIYSEAQSKSVYVNICVNRMRTLFPVS